jgi:hypothetical protein
MPLRIACDLDGTLADMDAALQREARALFGPEAAVGDLTDAQRRRLWIRVGEIEDFWLTLDEIEPGAVGRLGELASEYGWEVLFVTQRPASAGQAVQRQSQRWLQAHGFELPSVYVVIGSRGPLAATLALDAVLDDRPDNCVDIVTDSDARALLVWRRDPASIPPGTSQLGIEPVSSIAEALAILQQMSDRANQPLGLVRRVRAAFGL